MGPKCIAPGCTSGYKSNKEKVSFFKVPKGMLEQWSVAIPRKNFTLRENHTLCEKHFLEDEINREVVTDIYSYPLLVPRLEKDAIPSQWPNCPHYLSKTPSVKRRIIKKYLMKKPNSELESEHEISNTETSELASTSNEESSQTKKIFQQLISKTITLVLPTTSWLSHYISDGDNKLITFLEMVVIERNPIIQKKIVICEETVKLYVFEKLYRTFDETNCVTNSLSDLQNVCDTFDKQTVCRGGANVSKSPDNFKTSAYVKDFLTGKWRHTDCEYVFEREKTTKQQSNIYSCNFCQRSSASIRKFKSKAARGTISREDAFKKEAFNRRRREGRMKKRIKQLKEEILVMKHINEETLEKKIAAPHYDHIPAIL